MLFRGVTTGLHVHPTLADGIPQTDVDLESFSGLRRRFGERMFTRYEP